MLQVFTSQYIFMPESITQMVYCPNVKAMSPKYPSHVAQMSVVQVVFAQASDDHCNGTSFASLQS